jgi:hypothetical protein
MSRRRIDQETGAAALAWRENKVVDGFVAYTRDLPAPPSTEKMSSTPLATQEPRRQNTFTCCLNRGSPRLNG